MIICAKCCKVTGRDIYITLEKFNLEQVNNFKPSVIGLLDQQATYEISTYAHENSIVLFTYMTGNSELKSMRDSSRQVSRRDLYTYRTKLKDLEKVKTRFDDELTLTSSVFESISRFILAFN